MSKIYSAEVREKAVRLVLEIMGKLHVLLESVSESTGTSTSPKKP
ncbi:MULTISPECIES: hypothetical protein [Antrihabitans]|nr:MULTISPECIES: hypothetical protein [Antrihabitans]